jgi:hypothetical protein
MSTFVAGDYLSLCDAVERVIGRRIHLNTIRRWYRIGVSGIRLRVIFFDGRFHTTTKDVETFIQETTQAKTARHIAPPKLSVEEGIPPLKPSKAVDAAVRKFNAMKPKDKSVARRGRPSKSSSVGN